MPIINRNLTPGARLVGRYKKENHFCTVIETEGSLSFRLHTNGQEYPSLSAAANAVTNTSVNGWRFWSASSEAVQERLISEIMEKNGQVFLPRVNLITGESSYRTIDEVRADEETAAFAEFDPAKHVVEPEWYDMEGNGETLVITTEAVEGQEFTSPGIERTRTKSPFRKSRSQDDLAPNETRYFCSACGDHFIRNARETPVGPINCPKGHAS